MMQHIQFSVFDLSTRLITKNMQASSIDLVDMQCGPDESWVFGHWAEGQKVKKIGSDGYPIGLEPAPTVD